MKHVAQLLTLAAAAAVAAGCAGATVGSGVGERTMQRPPWTAGSRTPPPIQVGHLPILYQRGATQEAMFEPSDEEGGAVAQLTAAMNAYLDGGKAGVWIAPEGPMPGRPLDVQFGCVTDPLGECLAEEIGRPEMRLAVARPSQAWIDWLRASMDRAGADGALVITLEVGQLMPRQKNILGSKVVDLGTDYTVSLPWLTSLEAPVAILQLTGALVGRDGRAVRIGAEGLLARRTELVESSFGLQALITEEEVERLYTARREDLPGRPLVWQAGLDALVRQLLGR